MSPLLSVRDLGLRFGSQTVVQGVCFDIAAGEKIALVGESGSGKTVTALSLLGLSGAQVSGSVQWWGELASADTAKPDLSNHTHAPTSPQAAPAGRELLSLSEQGWRGIRGQDIAMVFQEPMSALNPVLTIGDQITEVLTQQGQTRAQAHQSALGLLRDVGLGAGDAQPLRAYPHQLSGGQRQRAMIAMALAGRPRLLLADEPTTALDVGLRGQILDLLDTLQRKHNMAVLLITHDLQLVRRFAQRVVVMAQGRVVEQGDVAQVFSQPQHAYTRQLLDSTPQRHVVEDEPNSPAQPSAPAALVVQAQQLRVRYARPRPGWRGWFKTGQFEALKGVDFALRRARTLGVVGESGSGKSSLALAVLGLLPADGTLQFTSAPASSWGQSKALDKALRQHIQVVFQDPFSALSPRMTVEAIVGEGLRVHAPALNAAQRQARVLASLAEVGLTEHEFPGLLQRYPHAFSGGQRQRLAIARALIVQPQILVLDEPTSALDVSIQKQVLDVLQKLQKEHGLSYLLISHDMAVIQAMAHDVLVMKDGQVLEAGAWQQVRQQPHHPYTQSLLAGL